MVGLVRIGDHDEEMVVDPATPLENLAAAPGVVGAILLAIGTPWYVVNQAPQALKAASYGLPLFLSGVVLSRMVEVNYRLDLRERTLSLYRRIFGWEQRRLVCSFSGIECVALDTRSELRKDGKRRRLEHRHGLAIVLKNGKVLTAIDNSYMWSR